MKQRDPGVRRPVILLAAVALLSLAFPTVGLADDGFEITIPINTIVKGVGQGSITELATAEVPVEFQGQTCSVVADAYNQESVHPDNDLIVSSGQSEVVIPNVEADPDGFIEGTGTLTLGSSITVSLRMGPDDRFSAGFDVIVDCTPTTPPSGWACINGEVEFIEDATNFGGTLYETEEEAAQDVNCTEVQAAIFVTVSASCEILASGPSGVIEVTLSVVGGADVVIRDSDGEVVGTLSEDGTITVPQGQAYLWEATANEGFQFPEGFDSTGVVDIGTCDEVMASIVVTVSSTCQVRGNDGQGVISADISVDDGADVVIRDSDGDIVGTFTSDGSVIVPEGATYTWQATPSEGFEFPSGAATSGSITIETCSNPETLPFTGPENLWMAPLAALLMAAGAFLLRGSKRFGEEA
jgi:hypothetical protein